MTSTYVHGYDPRESDRLRDQAGMLVDLLHGDTEYDDGSFVLEAGCGVGAQTITLAQRSPGARFISIDVSADSVEQARRRIESAGLPNVDFRRPICSTCPSPTSRSTTSSSASSSNISPTLWTRSPGWTGCCGRAAPSP